MKSLLQRGGLYYPLRFFRLAQLLSFVAAVVVPDPYLRLALVGAFCTGLGHILVFWASIHFAAKAVVTGKVQRGPAFLGVGLLIELLVSAIRYVMFLGLGVWVFRVFPIDPLFVRCYAATWVALACGSWVYLRVLEPTTVEFKVDQNGED